LGIPPAGLGTHSPVEWLVRTCSLVARALAEVHRHGLIHRDVKPSNILLRRDGSPVVADFGLARVDDLQASQTGAFAGTPVYAAPERLRGGDIDVDARTDIYSLGVTLYELLTLSPPFSGSSTHEVLRRIEGGNLPDLRKEAPHVSRDLAIVVQKAMETESRHRYATADEFADDLDRLLNLEPIRARPAGPIRRFVKFVRRNNRIVMAAGAGAILVAGATWPLVAHAQALHDSRLTAAQKLQEARSQLLSPEALYASWAQTLTGTSQQPLRSRTARSAHIAALQATRATYDLALEFDPTNGAARRERKAVEAALERELTRTEDATTPSARNEPDVKPRSNATPGAVRQPIVLAPDATPEDRFATGLLAFLVGDSETSHAAWDDLEAELPDHPLLGACRALQLANDGYPERAYPRLFHATRSFPEATALALAMAEASLVMGDTELGSEWLEKTRGHGEEQITQSRRRLLEGDLLAAKGDAEAAASIYRELVKRDPSDSSPLVRLAMLDLAAGNHIHARRMLTSFLQLWPDQWETRRHLAWLDLQQHNLPGYLRHVRHALVRQDDRMPRAAKHQLAEILRIGGLSGLLHDDGTPRPHPLMVRPALELSTWLRPAVVESIRVAMNAVATFDRTYAMARDLDTRPPGVALLTVWFSALQFPGLLRSLPGDAIMPILGLPLLLGAPTDQITSWTAPLHTILGNRSRVVVPVPLVPFHLESPHLFYAENLLRAGDLDGDTLEDFCVVSSSLDSDAAEARIEVRSLADGSLTRVLRDDGDRTNYGHGLAVFGDADGDRCNDLLIGCPNTASGPNAGDGRVELRSGRTGELLWVANGPGARFGWSVAMIDDVDGDGVLDFAAGMPTKESGQRGRAFVCSGADGKVLHQLAIEQDGGATGSLVAGLGDVDGDGAKDFLVTDGGGLGTGTATVFSGRTMQELFTFTGSSATANFGFRAAALGDVDGDDHGDFAITAPGISHPHENRGEVAVISGRTGKLLHLLRGEQRGEGFGIAICALPYWRDDGRPALAISAARGGPSGRGYVRIYDAIAGRPLQTLAPSPRARSFGHSLMDLGDPNNDGLRDLGLPLINRDDSCTVWSLSFALVEPR
ncbi:MAG: protein kinase, partial [Planctomycetes bacterium]|nr:protein kinase [Planctomycetota bacterium]